MDEKDFVVRLLKKRPLVFFGANDITILRKKGESGSTQAWNIVGKDNEDDKICIAEYMTYDEIAISALIGVSVPTYFINTGDRYNSGKKSDGNFEEYGVYVGLTGARFEKRDKMESLHVLVADLGSNSVLQEKAELLAIWAKFYGVGDSFPTYEDIKAESEKEDNKYLNIYIKHQVSPARPALFISKYVYKKRIEMSVLPFLLDANERIAEKLYPEKQKAYVHVVGLGLGVWQICPEQAGWMLEVYEDLISNQLKDKLPHIHTIDFSWFPEKSNLANVQDGKLNNINIVFSRRDPADKLSDSNLLLVAMYAWDGNAFPGNEYWRGMLYASGDPAAACCSTICELQNPYINEQFVDNVKWY